MAEIILKTVCRFFLFWLSSSTIWIDRVAIVLIKSVSKWKWHKSAEISSMADGESFFFFFFWTRNIINEKSIHEPISFSYLFVGRISNVFFCNLVQYQCHRIKILNVFHEKKNENYESSNACSQIESSNDAIDKIWIIALNRIGLDSFYNLGYTIDSHWIQDNEKFAFKVHPKHTFSNLHTISVCDLITKFMLSVVITLT